MINLVALQQEVLDWNNKNFPFRPTKGLHALIGLMEELGELAHAHLKQAQNIHTNEDHRELAEDAIGDLVIFLCEYCNGRDMDLELIITKTWAKVKQRDWTKNTETGKVLD